MSIATIWGMQHIEIVARKLGKATLYKVLVNGVTVDSFATREDAERWVAARAK